MKSKISTVLAPSLLAAGLVVGMTLGMTSVQAASHSVTPEKESQIMAGMSTAQVGGILGSPVEVTKYGNEEGSTWIYTAAQGNAFAPAGSLDFDVTFDANGRVVSASEWEPEFSE